MNRIREAFAMFFLRIAWAVYNYGRWRQGLERSVPPWKRPREEVEALAAEYRGRHPSA